MRFLLLLLLPFAVHAKVIAIGESMGDRITLTDERCVSAVMEKVKPEYRNNFNAATYYISRTRETVKGCYWLYEGQYLTIWEDGDVFALPPSFFKQTRI